MRKGRSLRFSHNREIPDESFKHEKVLKIGTKIDPQEPQMLGGRMRILLISGF